jgi:UDP-galactopyranose mutase
MAWQVDYLIVGAGLSGLVLAERLSSQTGANCLVVERRSHIGGNCFDEYSDHGVLIHRYGPHYFRTNSQAVIDYLSLFTAWRPVEYRVLSYTDQRYWSFPINLATFEQLIGRAATEAEFESYLVERRARMAEPKTSEDVMLAQVGRELYEKFFVGYTRKQWGCDPRELDASVCGRIPIRTNRDDRYLRESFQAMPAEGYTRMFERMLARSGRVRLLLNADYRDVREHVAWRHMIYTGAIDEYFDYCDGALPYRSLEFERQSFEPAQLTDRTAIAGRQGFWQPAVQVNYPNDERYTRIVEAKHVTGQSCANTTIVREYPKPWVRGIEPYYPVPSPDAQALYARYAARAKNESNVSFVGRLATYRYYNMDQVVASALAEFEAIRVSAAA